MKIKITFVNDTVKEENNVDVSFDGPYLIVDYRNGSYEAYSSSVVASAIMENEEAKTMRNEEEESE